MSIAQFHRQALGRVLLAYRASINETHDLSRRFVRRVSHQALVDNAKTWTGALHAHYERYARLMTVPEMLADPETSSVEGALEGFKIIRQIRADIAALPKTPTDFQLSIVWFVVELMASRIFGQTWVTDQVRIKKQMGWSKEHHGIGGVLSGRKEGKSTGFAMACIIILMNLKNIPIALFSRTKDQSCIILGMAKELLAGHPRVHSFKMMPSSCAIQLIASNADVRTMRAWSGTADVRMVRGGEGIVVNILEHW